MTDRLPDLDAYFARIGHAGPARADLATLAALARRHAEAIPFENLAAFLGETVPLDVESLQRKLCTPGRGGWCFEHNLFFARVLEALGFEVVRLAARVRWNVAPGVVTPRSHMLLRVRLPEGDFIADVGFGGLTLTAPLRLLAGIEQVTPHEPYRLVAEGERFALQARIAGEWQALYAFDLAPQEQADYEVSNWYLANHPQSQFVKGLIAARAAPDRRHALRNARYSIHHRDGRTERRTLADVAEIRAVLSCDIGLALPDTREFERKLATLLEPAA